MKRQIIKIDEELCNGCGECVPNCHEGALQVIDGKVRLISDLMCDGLGACIGHCPVGAIEIIEREAEPYNETLVIAEMVNKGANTVIAHLQHLKEHGETGFLQEGIDYLNKNKNDLKFNIMDILDKIQHEKKPQGSACGCPGSKEMSFGPAVKSATIGVPPVNTASALRQWPVQLHLVNSMAQYFQGADVVLAADCVAFALGDFHQNYLNGKSLAIACPKLDSEQETYIEKIRRLIDDAKVNTITVMIMEVPCCGGLLQLVRLALQQATRKVPVKLLIVSIQGEILKEEWI